MSLEGFTLWVGAEKENNFFNLPLYGLDLAPRQKKEKKQTYQHVRLTCNPTYERLKPWSLLFDLNGVTHELIVPQTNNFNFNNLGPNNKLRNAQISHYWAQDVLALTPSHKETSWVITLSSNKLESWEHVPWFP
jgi:hypothetical protein